jgi:hypothetical protein
MEPPYTVNVTMEVLISRCASNIALDQFERPLVQVPGFRILEIFHNAAPQRQCFAVSY